MEEVAGPAVALASDAISPNQELPSDMKGRLYTPKDDMNVD